MDFSTLSQVPPSHLRGSDLQNTSDFFLQYAFNIFVFQNAEMAKHMDSPFCNRSKNLFLHKEINEKSCNTALVIIISLSGCEKSPSQVNKVSPFAHNNKTYTIAALNIDDNLWIFYYHITYYLIILHLLEIFPTSHIIALTAIVFYISNYRYEIYFNKQQCIPI